MTKSSLKKQQTSITVRHPKFDFTGIPQYWMQGSQLFTEMYNAFSMQFPEGERFFIRSVKAFSDRIEDPKLKEEIKAFIGQEAAHGNAHDKANQDMREMGYEIDSLLDGAKNLIDRIEGFLHQSEYGKKVALSVTAALEHFTAAMSHMHFTTDELDNVYPVMREMIEWHSAEEIEHKHVAFDVLETVDDSYSLRLLGMVIAYVSTGAMITVGTTHMMRQNPIDWPAFAKDLFNLFTNENKMPRMGLRSVLQYLTPGFHPLDVQDLHLAAAVAEKYEKSA